jgi:hypothetical protein
VLIPVGFAQVNYVFSGPAAPTGAQITVGIDVSGQTDPDATYVDAIGLAFAGNVMNLMVDEITLDEVRVKYGPNATGRTVVVAFGTPGAINNVSENPNTAVLVQKHTALGGRAGRGRCYIPGALHDVFDSSGVMSGLSLAAWQAEVAQWFLDLSVAGADPVLLHGADSPIAVPTPITAVEVQNKSATQRQRLRR